MRCSKCGGFVQFDSSYDAWKCLNCGNLRYPTIEEQRPELNVSVVSSMVAMPEWQGRSENYLVRQFKRNPTFSFVVRLENGGFASNYSSLTPAMNIYNTTIKQGPRYPFCGGFSVCGSGT
jgi:hypothetical protein